MNDPSGCRWCGISQHDHMQRWKPPVGWHAWEQPTQEQIKDRMRARRTERTTRPVRGQLGLWTVGDDTLAAVQRQINLERTTT